MAEETKNEKKAAKGEKSEAARVAKKGDDVRLVTASGEAVPAVVEEAHKDGSIDLVANYREADLVITHSPRDDSKKQADSWHFAD